MNHKSPKIQITGIPSSSYFSRRKGAILTFGVFDGVHVGHQSLLSQMSIYSRKQNVPSVAIIFRPKPIEALGLGEPTPYLSSTDETVRALEEIGIDKVGVLKFTKRIALMPPRDFLTALKEQIPFCELWLGKEAKVGRGPEGKLREVSKFGKKLGYKLKIIDEDGSDITVNSILDCLESRDIRGASTQLSRPYKLSAYVFPDKIKQAEQLDYYSIVVPEFMYHPPDGYYYVRIVPVSYEGVKAKNDSKDGYGFLKIFSPRLSLRKTEMGLLFSEQYDFSDSFVRIEFLENIEMPTSVLEERLNQLA